MENNMDLHFFCGQIQVKMIKFFSSKFFADSSGKILIMDNIR